MPSGWYPINCYLHITMAVPGAFPGPTQSHDRRLDISRDTAELKLCVRSSETSAKLAWRAVEADLCGGDVGVRQLGRGSGHETVVFLVQDSRVQASSLQIMILQHQACRSCTAASSSLYHLVCSAYAATSVQVIQCCVCLSAQHFAFGYRFLCGMTQICRALQGASILSTCVCDWQGCCHSWLHVRTDPTEPNLVHGPGSMRVPAAAPKLPSVCVCPHAPGTCRCR